MATPDAEPSVRRTSTRYHYLDGLRGAASLLVVIHHGFLLVDFGIYSGNPADSHFSWDIWLSGKPLMLMNAGNFAVAIFFVLSGFVLAYSFSGTRLSALALIVKRYCRLTVPILAASLFAFVVISTLTREPLPGAPSTGRSFDDLVSGLAYCLNEALYRATFTGLKGGIYNGVLWTMCIEFWGSVILIGIFVCARMVAGSARSRTVWTAGLLILFAVLTWNSYLLLFAAGAILYLVFGDRQTRMVDMPTWACLAVILVALVLGTLPMGQFHSRFYNPLLFLFGGSFESMAALSAYHPLLKSLHQPDWVLYPTGPFAFWHGVGAVLLVAALCKNLALKRLLSARFFQWLGLISFPLYLIHGTIQKTVARWLLHAGLLGGMSYGVAGALAIIGYVAVSLALANLFANLLERRATRWASLAGEWVDARLVGMWRVRRVGIT